VAGKSYSDLESLSGWRRLQGYGGFEWLEEVPVIWRVCVAGGGYSDMQGLSGWRRLQSNAGFEWRMELTVIWRV